ncbi:MAG: hypothetical protein RIA64_12495 [Rhodospirillales bacterium]
MKGTFKTAAPVNGAVRPRKPVDDPDRWKGWVEVSAVGEAERILINGDGDKIEFTGPKCHASIQGAGGEVIPILDDDGRPVMFVSAESALKAITRMKEGGRNPEGAASLPMRE